MGKNIISPGEKLFVYGALKPGGRYWPAYCEGRVVASVPAMVRGRLYHLSPGYPGFVPDPDSWTHGYVLYLRDMGTLRKIDQLEGYHPDLPEEECEYLRVRMPSFDPTGDPFEVVWVYVMRPETIRRLNGVPVLKNIWTEAGVSDI